MLPSLRARIAVATILLGLPLLVLAAAPLGDGAKKDIGVGPLNLTFGPEDSGHLGVVLKGSSAAPIDWFEQTRPPCREPGFYFRRMAFYELHADAGWSSAPQAANHATLGFRVDIGGAFGNQPQHDRERCLKDLNRERVRVVKPTDPNDPPEGIFDDLGRLRPRTEGAAIPDDVLTILPFGDFSYRDAQVVVDGQNVQANQQIVGGGLSIWYTSALTDFPGFFREWPRFYAGYYHVKDTSEGAIPLPTGLLADHVAADLVVRSRLPFPGTALKTSPILLNVDVRYSRAVGSITEQKNEFLGTYQLAYNVAGSVKPALTYRAGDERGLEYDKQVILGILWSLAAQ